MVKRCPLVRTLFFNFVRGFRCTQPNDFDCRVITLAFSLEILLKVTLHAGLNPRSCTALSLRASFVSDKSSLITRTKRELRTILYLCSTLIFTDSLDSVKMPYCAQLDSFA